MAKTVRAVHICGTATFEQGDPPPPPHDYLGWHSWADVQHKAGLRQSVCSRCGLYQFPQEMTVSHCLSLRGMAPHSPPA